MIEDIYSYSRLYLSNRRKKLMGVAFGLVFTIYSLALTISILNIVKAKTSQFLIKRGNYLRFVNH